MDKKLRRVLNKNLDSFKSIMDDIKGKYGDDFLLQFTMNYTGRLLSILYDDFVDENNLTETELKKFSLERTEEIGIHLFQELISIRNLRLKNNMKKFLNMDGIDFNEHMINCFKKAGIITDNTCDFGKIIINHDQKIILRGELKKIGVPPEILEQYLAKNFEKKYVSESPNEETIH